METINSLTKKISSCITKRKYSVNSVISKFAQHTVVLNYRITELLFKRLSGDINDTEAASQIEHFYDDNDDLNGYAKTLRSDTLKKCFNRYVSCENRIPVEAPNAILDIYGLEVNVDPTYMFVDASTKALEVVKILFKKPELSQSAASKSIALYSMLYYGKLVGENMFPGENVKVTASFYYLIKDNDRENSLHPEKDNFDSDFFNQEGKNVLSIKDENRGDCPENQRMTAYDTGMYQIIQDFIAGSNMSYSGYDCKYCSLKDVCSFNKSKAPIPSFSQGGLVTKFTDEQTAILDAEKGNFSVVAGAGSGKTSVIGGKVIRLLKSGIKPEEIVVITFTNASAQEMKERIAKMILNEGLDVDVEAMAIMTFNAYGDIYLQRMFQYFGFTDMPELAEPSSTKQIIEKLVLENFIDGVNYKYLRDEEGSFMKSGVGIVQDIFNTFKSYGITKDNLKEKLDFIKNKLSSISDYFSDQMLYDLTDLYELYENQMLSNGLYDYTDQERAFRVIDNMDPDYFKHTGIKALIVDEDQDMNEAQFEIIKILKKSNVFETLLIVGDPDQSIYGFRGASPESAINADKILGEPVTKLYITKNFRCTEEIVECANKFIDANKIRIKKNLVSTKGHGQPVTVKAFKSGANEVAYICEDIAARVKAGTDPTDIAVIARKKSELYKIEEYLNAMGIDSTILVPEYYRTNSRVRGILSLFKFLNEPEDEADIVSYINVCNNGKWFDLTDKQRLQCLEDNKAYAASFADFSEEEKLSVFLEMANRIPGVAEDEIYAKYLEKITGVKTWSQLSRIIFDFSIYGGDDQYTKKMKYSGVTLTTAHSSKGLEWPVVYVTTSGFDKEIFHGNLTEQLQREIEEERRLLYVSFTRARDILTITGKYYCYGNATTFKGTKQIPGGENKNFFLAELYKIYGKDDLVTEYKKVK